MNFLLNITIVFFFLTNYETGHKITLQKNAAEATDKSKQAKTRSSKKKFKISGTVTQTHSYCGGARPTQEVLEQAATPRIYSGKKFYVIKGDTNTAAHQIVLSFTSDEQGNFSFLLPAGTYSIIQNDQASPLNVKKYITETISADDKCLKKWWAKPYYVLQVKKSDIAGLKFEFHQRCFIQGDVPCLQYNGPPVE